MKVVGICGGSGSGKSTLSALFLKHGVPVIDADRVYSELTAGRSACMEAIAFEFGCGVVNPDWSLNREALSREVFFSERAGERRARLNEITHAYVLERIDSDLQRYASEGKAAVVVDIPLMFECGFDKKCDLTISVTAKRELRILRITERDGISVEAAERRIDAMRSDEFLRENTDITFDNSGTLSDLESFVDSVLIKIGHKAQN